jgi:hypothetical protein
MMEYLILAAVCLGGACECYEPTVRPYTMVEASPLQARNGDQSAYYEPCLRPSHGGPPTRAIIDPLRLGTMVIGPIEEVAPDGSIHCNNCPEEDQK